mmetsp:Transcript_57726/g.172268  ORF Transcript_57726/g.172268 Transcript_57726/m.172268 type:complete len:331 (+) Transcript_57726:805-1797(+)
MEDLGPAQRDHVPPPQSRGELGREHRRPSKVEEVRGGVRGAVQVQQLRPQRLELGHQRIDRARDLFVEHPLQNRGDGVGGRGWGQVPLRSDRGSVGLQAHEVGGHGVPVQFRLGRRHGGQPVYVPHVAHHRPYSAGVVRDVYLLPAGHIPLGARGGLRADGGGRGAVVFIDELLDEQVADAARINRDLLAQYRLLHIGPLGGTSCREGSLHGVQPVVHLGQSQPLCQFHPQKFVGVGFGEGVHKDEALGPFGGREPLLPQELVERMEVDPRPPRLDDDHYSHHLLKNLVRRAEGRAGPNVRVAQDGLLHFQRTDNFPPAVDHLLGSTRDV